MVKKPRANTCKVTTFQDIAYDICRTYYIRFGRTKFALYKHHIMLNIIYCYIMYCLSNKPHKISKFYVTAY